jgi:hypothetical protein
VWGLHTTVILSLKQRQKLYLIRLIKEKFDKVQKEKDYNKELLSRQQVTQILGPGGNL